MALFAETPSARFSIFQTSVLRFSTREALVSSDCGAEHSLLSSITSANTLKWGAVMARVQSRAASIATLCVLEDLRQEIEP